MNVYSKLLLLLILPILLLTFSCSKDGGNIKAGGTVVDKNSGEAVSDAMVYLRRKSTSSGYDLTRGPSYTPIDSQQADQDGKFIFPSFSGDNSYDVIAKKENYFDDGNYAVNVPGGGATDLKVPMEAKAYLKIHVINTNPVDDNDIIRYSGHWDGGYYTYGGTKVDINNTYIVRGNDKIKIGWSVIKNNIQNNYEDSIFCPAHDTTLYEIKY